MKCFQRLAGLLATVAAAAFVYVPVAHGNDDGSLIQLAHAPETDAYKVTVTNPSVKVGAEGFIKVTINAKAGFKINEEYKHKVKVKNPPAEVEVPKVTTGAFSGKKKYELAVPIKAKSAGKHAVPGQIRFSVCDESQCLIKKVNLDATVNAS